MRTVLYAHNKTAYQKVMKAFETSDRTCVVHPTGTGKSFLIAAVSESYKKVLILGPNIFVLDQVHDVLKWRKRGVEYMTYQTLNLTENPHTDYDLICLDEFHRAGAQEWGAAVDRLLSLNTEAKVFGTTATHIRYLDNERNMADEIFDGNIASHITIAEAWNRNILPIPRYVSGLFRWDKTLDDAKDRISKSRSLSDKEKRERIFRLTNAHLHWELSYGMPTILKKHLDSNTRRIIVFCGGIESIWQMRQEVIGWFREAGFTIASTCIMHSDLTDRDQREQMKQFEDDTDGKGVKLMFSVNMLNEGIHVPNVNAVLMLRTTASRIIYMQQMGRCLTAANSQKPMVLDMVDNITTTTAIKDIADEFDAIEIPQAEHEGREPRKFEVKDYTLGVKDLIDKLVPETFDKIPYEERLAMATAFCEANSRPPGGRKDPCKEKRNWFAITQYYRDRPESKALIEKYGIRHQPLESKITQMEKFTTEHGRRPLTSEKAMHKMWASIVALGKNNPRVLALREKYGSKKVSLEGKIVFMQQFTTEKGRRPLRSEKREHMFWAEIVYNAKDDERVKQLREQYGGKFKTPEENIQQMIDFTTKHDRAPRHDTDHKDYIVWTKMKERSGDDPRVKAMIEKYGIKVMSQEEKIILMQQFTAEHNRRPLYAERDLYNKWSTMIRQDDGDPRVKAMMDKYHGENMTRERRISQMQQFTDEHDRRPLYEESKPYRTWKYIISHYMSDPRVKAMTDKYGIKINQ